MRQRIETHQSQPFIADQFRRFLYAVHALGILDVRRRDDRPGRFLPLFTLQLPHFSHPFLRQFYERVLLVCNAV